MHCGFPSNMPATHIYTNIKVNIESKVQKKNPIPQLTIRAANTMSLNLNFECAQSKSYKHPIYKRVCITGCSLCEKKVYRGL